MDGCKYLLGWALATFLCAGAPGGVASGETNRQEVAMVLTSTAFEHQGQIPVLYTGEGRDISPPLAWTGVPETARSLVLIVDDPDAPDPRAPKMTWVHWVLYNLPPQTASLPQAARASDLPVGTREGLNDWRRTGYGGPMPPVGVHRYFFKLYALDEVLPGLDTPTKASLERVMTGHVVAKAELIGTYRLGSRK